MRFCFGVVTVRVVRSGVGYWVLQGWFNLAASSRMESTAARICHGLHRPVNIREAWFSRKVSFIFWSGFLVGDNIISRVGG